MLLRYACNRVTEYIGMSYAFRFDLNLDNCFTYKCDPRGIRRTDIMINIQGSPCFGTATAKIFIQRLTQPKPVSLGVIQFARFWRAD